DFGPFTGAVPYPDQVFAPFTTEGAGAPAESPRDSVTPANAEIASAPARRRQLGIDATPAAGGVRGVRGGRGYPGSAAGKAGLHVGDVLRSISGRPVERPDDLSRLLSGFENVLAVEVRSASDGRDRAVRVQLPQ